MQKLKIVYNNKMTSPSIPNTRRSTLSLEQIERAATSIDPVFRNSPQFESEPLSSAVGCSLVLKIETLNPIRSFKGRGADYFVSSLGPDAKLVCGSAGNFGQAMAYACRKRGIAQERLDQLVSGIQRQIETLGESEVPAKTIGEMVMNGLHELDAVA